MTDQETSQTYRVPVSTGIFSHSRRLREAHWLLLYYVDKTTEEYEGFGSRMGAVLGGRPCLDSDAAGALGRCAATISRWRNELARLGYITQRWTGRGWIVWVNKSKKWNWNAVPLNLSSQSQQECRVRVNKSVESELPF